MSVNRHKCRMCSDAALILSTQDREAAATAGWDLVNLLCPIHANGGEPARVQDGTWSTENICAGLFGPCSNKPDPKYKMDDPDGKLPPVHRCAECGEAGDAFMKMVFDQGKGEKLAFELDALKVQTTYDRGKS